MQHARQMVGEWNVIARTHSTETDNSTMKWSGSGREEKGGGEGKERSNEQRRCDGVGGREVCTSVLQTRTNHAHAQQACVALFQSVGGEEEREHIV